jgi:hypothetical protein
MPCSRVNLGENVRSEMCDLLNRCLVSTIDAAAHIEQDRPSSRCTSCSTPHLDATS